VIFVKFFCFFNLTPGLILQASEIGSLDLLDDKHAVMPEAYVRLPQRSPVFILTAVLF
jgi:hypothetical protein